MDCYAKKKMASQKIKQTLKQIIASPLGWRISAPIRRHGVVVLTYHRVNREEDIFPGMQVSQFRNQMSWLKKNCTIIGPEQLFEASRQSRRVRPSVLVTFDDGYRDYIENAYPILFELRIPALMFLATDFIDNGGLIWTDALYWAVMHTEKKSLTTPWSKHGNSSLQGWTDKIAFITACKEFLKGISDISRREWMEQLISDLKLEQPPAYLSRQMLTWKEIRQADELTVFGGHSHTHPILSRLNVDSMEREIVLCRDRIASELGEPPIYFAYPNGRLCDFNETTKSLLKRHGFTMAFSNVGGINGRNLDPYALYRQPSGGSSIGDFAALVANA